MMTTGSTTLMGSCPQVHKQTHLSANEEALGDSSADGNPVFRRVVSDLRTAQHEFGSNHNSVAEAWNALGLVRVHMQRDAKAAQLCHEEALRIYSKNFQHAEMAVTLNDLGFCHEQQGNHTDALELYEDAMRILFELDLGESHPRVIATQRAVSRIRRSWSSSIPTATITRYRFLCVVELRIKRSFMPRHLDQFYSKRRNRLEADFAQVDIEYDNQLQGFNSNNFDKQRLRHDVQLFVYQQLHLYFLTQLLKGASSRYRHSLARTIATDYVSFKVG